MTIFLDSPLKSRIAHVLSPHPITLAYLFGSVATGQATPSSDVDIALVVDERRLDRSGRLKFELAIEEEIARRCEIGDADVRVINDAPLILRGQVACQGVLVFARDDESRIDFETRARAEYFDFLPADNFMRDAFFQYLRHKESHMLNPQKVEGMIRGLKDSLDQLREIAKGERGAFLKDGTKIGAAKYYLQISIEACIDIGNHIIAALNYRKPKDYRDVFTVLNENDIIPDEFTLTLRQMAGLRNRLVHLYWEVDDEEIYQDLRDELGDFDLYIERITDFLRRQTPPPDEAEAAG